MSARAILAAFAVPVLAPLSLGFGAAVRLRRAAYARGWLAQARAGIPVVSVGNLAAGGSGKTPFTMLLAERLLARGLRVAVLSRGYRSRAEREGRVVVVSRGDGPLVSAEEGGDEPVLIARRTRAQVVVAPDRRRAAEVAARELGAEVAILDDGLQHLRLARDLELVLVDAEAPLGHLLPWGRLREPPSVLARADVVVVVRTPGVSADTHRPAADLRARLEGLAPGVARVEVAVVPRMLEPSGRPAAALRGEKVALLAGIARPERFEASVRALGAEVVARTFLGDHAPIDRRVLEAFRAEADRAGARVLLTTEKDAARLGPAPAAGLGLETLGIAHVVTAGAEHLDRALDRILPGEGR